MTSLSKEYTRDQFIGLSQRKPDVNPYGSEFYYRLEMTEMGDGEQFYPTFKVGTTHIVDFPTFDSATDYMEKHSQEMNLYRSRITQCPLFEDVKKRGAQWLYDKDGKLIDCTNVQKIGTPEETHFFGRSLEKQRFKPGDVAELLDNDKVRLAYIVARTRTPEECWEIFKQQGAEYSLDYSADSYAIINNDEDHISYGIATALMKPRFPITDDMKVKMERRYIAMIESALDGTNPTMKMVRVWDSEEEYSDKELSPYGFGKNPPYSLYQAENGKWGLIDGRGNKLPPEFKRGDNDCFSRVPWEVVTFDPQEGFELQAWYDPDEVWFNFTFDNTDYPAEYAPYLWEKPTNDVETYRDVLYNMVPSENHWLIDDILQQDALTKEADVECAWTIDEELLCHPELADPAVTNQMLEQVMRNAEVDKDVKITLWRAKVALDYHIIKYNEDDSDEM